MNDQNLIIHPDILREVKASLLIASAAGAMEHLRGMEPHSKTRRSRELGKVAESMMGLFGYYPLAADFDIIDLGSKLFDDELETRIDSLLRMGLVKKWSPEKKCYYLDVPDRYCRGDVLMHPDTRKEVVVSKVCEDEYWVISDIAELYSRANWPSDPYLFRWKKIMSLGEDVSRDEISCWFGRGP